MGLIISPRELAEAIGASESSLKRWADDGHIRVSRTAGGHRRIAIGEAIRFVRAMGAPLVRPELLGLSDLATGNALRSGVEPTELLCKLLSDGNAREARGLILSLYLGGASVAEIADGPIRHAMERIGQLWRHGESGVYLEHCATGICVQAVEQLRRFVEPETPRAVAVGGAPAGDPYLLPSLLIATALEAEGWRAVNLGPNTPFTAFHSACEHRKPALVWITVTAMHDASEIEDGVSRLVERLARTGSRIALGGQALPEFPSFQQAVVHRCESIADLIRLTQTLDHAAAPDAPTALTD